MHKIIIKLWSKNYKKNNKNNTAFLRVEIALQNIFIISKNMFKTCFISFDCEAHGQS